MGAQGGEPRQVRLPLGRGLASLPKRHGIVLVRSYGEAAA